MAITKTLVDWAASTMRSMRPEGTDAVAGPPGLPAPGVPSRIGRFLVIKPIGSGAAGVVYAAYDPELDRQVAIKCLRSAVRDPAAGERLRREARSLARLSHPNVVTVHDVGAVDAAKAAEGQDTCFFIAMELVDGMSLGAWLLKETRPWREVIDLLVQAGHGLAAAHGAGLLHRDFKPENVLVTSDGRAQVADFGLACAVNNPASEHGTGAATTVARLVGTPAYMAPETMEQPADERSDQFSYCATLYEALFGVLPHSGKGLVPLWNAKVHGELTPITDRRGVPRWLEEAVVKGLSPNPVDRWESLDELIAVLERPSRRRKISALAAAALLAAGLAAGSGVTTAINGVNSTICDAAPEPWRGVWDDGRRDELRRAFAESPVGFAGDTWDRVSDGLDAYVERWNASREAICREQRTESVGDLDLHRQMACITERQEEVRVLVNILMKAEPTVIEQASAAIDGLDSPNDCRADGALEARGVETGRSLVLRRHLAAVRSHHAVGDYEHAVELAAAVTADVRELGHTSLLADALFDLGRTLHSVGDLEGSIEAYEEATRVAVAHHHYSVAIRALIHTGQHNASTGDFAASENRMNEAAVLLERLPGSIARGIKPSLWIAYGRHYLERGEYVRAQVQFKRARAALVRLGETESGRYARATANLGSSHYRESELAEARKAYEEELELRQELHGAAHPKVAAVLQRLGAVAYSEGRLEDAELILEQVIEMTSDLGLEHPFRIAPLRLFALISMSRHNYERAKGVFEESMRLTESHWGGNSPKVARDLIGLGLALSHLGEFDRGEEVLRRAVAIRERALGETNPVTLDTWSRLADLICTRGDFADAAVIYRRVLETHLARDEKPTLKLVLAHVKLGESLLLAGELGEAERRLRSTLDMIDHIGADKTWYSLNAIRMLGEVLVRNNQPTAGLEMLEKALVCPAFDTARPRHQAQARFALARALGEGDPRALELAQLAREGLETSDEPADRKYTLEIRDWLIKTRS